MNKRQISTRRRPAQKGGKVLRAITKKDRPKKKYRAVAAKGAADFQDEQSGLGGKIVGGLLLLLLFHLVAIGAIAIHSNYSKGSVESAEKEALGAPIIQSKDEKSALDRIKEETTKIKKNEPHALVYSGETYQAVADRVNVDVDELKKLNKNRALHAGLVLKVPRREVKVVSPAVDAVGNKAQATVHNLGNDVQVISDGTDKPNIQVSTRTTQATSSGYITHTFKSGDTFWGLGTKYGVKPSAIEKANPKLDPTKIRVGTKINIPQ